MEGLLPMVYRAIKKHRTRRQYKCLSSRSGELFYPLTQGLGYNNYQEPSIQNAVDDHHAKNFGHWRCNSVGDFYDGFSSPRQMAGGARGPDVSKQVVMRFRSHKLFSCVTG